MIFKHKIIVLSFLFLPLKIFGQKNIINDDQNLIWTRLHFTGNLSKKINFQVEADNRIFFKNARENQFIAHGHFHYLLNQKVEFSTGYTFSKQISQFPDDVKHLAIPERRIFQEFYFRKKINTKFNFQNRLRTEQRFFRNSNDFILLSGYNFNWRIREQININLKINRKIKLKLSDEIMLNYGKKIVYNRFDQNRLYAAIEYNINDKISVEGGYIKIFQKRANQFDYFDRNVIRLTLFSKFDFYKK
jgi:hypothetical protein